MSEHDSIFTKIINREVPGDIVYEDDEMIAITDINPKAPVHLLLIPKKPITSLQALTKEDAVLLGSMMTRIPQIATEAGIAESGYKVITNIGEHGGQIVEHLHFHILGGEPLKGLT